MRCVPVLICALLVGAVVAAGSAVAATFTDPTGDTFVIPQGADVTERDPGRPHARRRHQHARRSRLPSASRSPTRRSRPTRSSAWRSWTTDRNPSTGDEGHRARCSTSSSRRTAPTSSSSPAGTAPSFIEVPTTATSSFAAGVLTLTVPRSDLVNTRRPSTSRPSPSSSGPISMAGDRRRRSGNGDPVHLRARRDRAARADTASAASRPTGAPAQTEGGQEVQRSAPAVTRQDTGAAVTVGQRRVQRAVGARSRPRGRALLRRTRALHHDRAADGQGEGASRHNDDPLRGRHRDAGGELPRAAYYKPEAALGRVPRHIGARPSRPSPP